MRKVARIWLNCKAFLGAVNIVKIINNIYKMKFVYMPKGIDQ
jgi:hypothetical protein